MCIFLVQSLIACMCVCFLPSNLHTRQPSLQSACYFPSPRIRLSPGLIFQPAFPRSFAGCMHIMQMRERLQYPFNILNERESMQTLDINSVKIRSMNFQKEILRDFQNFAVTKVSRGVYRFLNLMQIREKKVNILSKRESMQTLGINSVKIWSMNFQEEILQNFFQEILLQQKRHVAPTGFQI